MGNVHSKNTIVHPGHTAIQTAFTQGDKYAHLIKSQKRFTLRDMRLAFVTGYMIGFHSKTSKLPKRQSTRNRVKR